MRFEDPSLEESESDLETPPLLSPRGERHKESQYKEYVIEAMQALSSLNTSDDNLLC